MEKEGVEKKKKKFEVAFIEEFKDNEIDPKVETEFIDRPCVRLSEAPGGVQNLIITAPTRAIAMWEMAGSKFKVSDNDEAAKYFAENKVTDGFITVFVRRLPTGENEVRIGRFLSRTGDAIWDLAAATTQLLPMEDQQAHFKKDDELMTIYVKPWTEVADAVFAKKEAEEREREQKGL